MAEKSESDIRDARRQRRQLRDHGEELAKAEELRLATSRGDVQKDGERVTRVEGEEEEGFEEEEKDKFEPFNLREEMETGYFDQDGHYVWQRKDQEDEWEKEMREARDQNKGKDVLAKASKSLAQVDDEAKPASVGQVVQWKKQLLPFLKPNETVVGALKRFRPTPKPRPKPGKAKAKAGADAKPAQSEEDARRDEHNRIAFAKLTELADNLMNAGYHDVYTDKPADIRQSLANDEGKIAGAGVKRKEQDTPPDDPSSKRQRGMAGYVWDEALKMHRDPATGWCFCSERNAYFWQDPNTGQLSEWDGDGNKLKADNPS